MVLFLCKVRQRERSILIVCEELAYRSLTQQMPHKTLKNHYKVVVATLSKKNEMGAYLAYVTISFCEDKEANAAL